MKRSPVHPLRHHLRGVVFAALLMAASACDAPPAPRPAPIPAPEPAPAAHQAAIHGSCGAASCGEADHGGGSCCNAAPNTQTAAAAPALRMLEDPSQVCMVRNHFMGRPQLAIDVEGHRYFGCCEGCRNRLATDARLRAAVDPVSGRAVDKAVAVVGVNARGGLVYFENAANLRAYADSLN